MKFHDEKDMTKMNLKFPKLFFLRMLKPTYKYSSIKMKNKNKKYGKHNLHQPKRIYHFLWHATGHVNINCISWRMCVLR